MVEQEGGGYSTAAHLATLPGVMKRPADALHPLAPIFQPNEGASRGGVKNEPALRSEKREIHLHANHGEPTPPSTNPK